MKKILILLLALCSLFLNSKGQVLYDETFDYTVSNLALEPTWTTAGTLTTGTGRNIVSPALTYSNSGGPYFLSGAGKTINCDISSATAYYSLKPFTSTPVTTGPVYLTFIYKPGVTQVQSQSEVFGMAINTNAGAKVYVGKGAINTTYFRFGTTRGSQSSADIKWGTTEFADVNEVFLIVLKYDFATQTSSIYINPIISGTEPTTPEVFDNTSATIRTSLNNFWFRANGTSVSKYNVSGARVSTSWASAVAVQIPKLPSPIVGVASAISNSGFTANWTQVANATGYIVKVYSGTTLVNTTNASGQVTESVAISGLSSGTTYTYKVTAVGDGINYTNSDPSAESTAFTTLGLLPPVVGIATNITASGFTANWTPVANATGYEVRVYLGTQLVSTSNATGQATSSLAVTGLSFGTSYTFVVIAKGDGTTYFDSTPSAASAVFITSYVILDTIHTDLGDGTWGIPVPETPANGTFPSYSINGFILEKAVVREANKKDRRGEEHINDFNLDKNSYNSLVVFPEINSVEQIEIHAYTGTAERSFVLEEYNTSTSVWDLIGTYVYNTASKASGLDSIYVIPISRAVPTKFRVRNNGSGGMSVVQVITRLTNPVTLPAPVVGIATDITRTGFTANWTPVTNATGYEVFLYKRTSLISKTNTTGQAVSALAITGLIPDSTYTYKVMAKGDNFVNFADSYLSAASAPFTTLSPIAPSIQDPTATNVLNNSATLGGNITYDGDNAIIERGTVWNTSTGVTITNNKLADTSTSIGVFSHVRTPLPAKSHIFYKAYASNSVGTTLTLESDFYTLADEPINQVTNFTAVATGATTVELSWTAVAADGYFILQKQGSSAPTGIPMDATVYPAGTVLGDGSVAANISSGTTAAFSIGGLSPNSTYSFCIMSVNSDGLNAATYNYYTVSSPTATTTTLAPPAGTYFWNQSGTASWAIPGNWSPTRTNPQINDVLEFNSGGNIIVTNVPDQTIGQLLLSYNTNLELQASAPVTLTIKGETGVDLDVPVGSALSIAQVAGGINIAFATGATAAIGGNFSTNSGINVGSGTFTVASGASFITNGTITGDVTIERDITAGPEIKHHFVSPITTNVINSSTSVFNGSNLEKYLEPNGTWASLVLNDPILPLTGYSINYPTGNTRTLSFVGALQPTPVAYTNLSYTNPTTPPGNESGYHLVGNPYPSGINPELCTLSGDLNAFAYVWNGANYNPLSIGTSDFPGIIASLQGFVVRTGSATNSLTLTSASKTLGGTFLKNIASLQDRLKLTVNGNGYSDVAYIRFVTGSTTGFDQALDAYKLAGITMAPQMYSILTDTKAAVNTLPSYVTSQNVPLGLMVGAASTYTISAEGIESFNPTVPIFLQDLKLGSVQDLRINPVYSFTAAPGDLENRFKVWFTVITSNKELDNSGIRTFSANGTIHVVQDGIAEGDIYVYSTSGQLVASSSLNSGETKLYTNASGVYIVKVVTKKLTVTQKVVVTQ
jgi:hypothetical protein